LVQKIEERAGLFARCSVDRARAFQLVAPGVELLLVAGQDVGIVYARGDQRGGRQRKFFQGPVDGIAGKPLVQWIQRNFTAGRRMKQSRDRVEFMVRWRSL
jgi:hypothetical protein